MLGTLMYMAPEIVRKENFTEKSDMWSTGVALYIMITGKTPYKQSEKLQEILPAVQMGTVDLDCKYLHTHLLLLIV